MAAAAAAAAATAAAAAAAERAGQRGRWAGRASCMAAVPALVCAHDAGWATSVQQSESAAHLPWTNCALPARINCAREAQSSDELARR